MCARLRHPREAGVHASLDSLPRLREGRLFAGMTGTVSLAQPGECCGVPGIVSQKKLGIGIIVDGTGRERAAMGDGLTTEPLDFRPRWRKTARAELPYVLRAGAWGCAYTPTKLLYNDRWPPAITPGIVSQKKLGIGIGTLLPGNKPRRLRVIAAEARHPPSARPVDRWKRVTPSGRVP
jgi:hypothetical protein